MLLDSIEYQPKPLTLKTVEPKALVNVTFSPPVKTFTYVPYPAGAPIKASPVPKKKSFPGLNKFKFRDFAFILCCPPVWLPLITISLR